MNRAAHLIARGHRMVSMDLDSFGKARMWFDADRAFREDRDAFLAVQNELRDQYTRIVEAQGR